MKDFISKTLKLVVGAAVTTGEKIESIVDELVQKGEISVEEGKKLAQEAKKKFEENFKTEKDKEIEILKKRIAEMEEQLKEQNME